MDRGGIADDFDTVKGAGVAGAGQAGRGRRIDHAEQVAFGLQGIDPIFVDVAVETEVDAVVQDPIEHRLPVYQVVQMARPKRDAPVTRSVSEAENAGTPDKHRPSLTRRIGRTAKGRGFRTY